ncbi:MAG: tetratricopeptide repeat protein [Acidobacteriota bacterium]|nr:tetratricopeptide repeat protein [Acidobacteriota bacterium]
MLRLRLKAFVLAALAVVLVAAAAQAQDWRGAGRIGGTVTDEAGHPLEGVTVKLFLPAVKEGTTVKTNKKGEWAANGIASGNWQVDFSMPGYDARKLSASVSELVRTPPMDIVMKKAKPTPNEEIRDELLKAAALLRQDKFADARAIYEGIMDKYPQVHQMLPLIARTYEGEKNYPKAIETLQLALKAEPDNVQLKLLLASVYGQNGQFDLSKQEIDAIDPAKLTDPTVVLNIGISMLNQKQPEGAMEYFNKTIARFPDFPDAYYYRGITNLQLEHNDAAKADLEKYIQIAPSNAPEIATAKKMLDMLKG